MGVSLVKRKGEQGSALLLTIIVLVVLLFLAGSLGLLAMVEGRMAQKEEASMQAFYLARSGADAVAEHIINNPVGLSEELLNVESNPVYLDDRDSAYFTVCLTRNDDASTITVQSTGVVGEQRAGVALSLEGISVIPSFDHAIVGLGQGSSLNPSITLSGNSKIYGDMATNSTEAGSVKMSGNTTLKGGTLLVGPDAEDPDNVVNASGNSTYTVGTLESTINYPNIAFPVFPSLPPGEMTKTKEDKNPVIDQDGKYAVIETKDTLIIDVGQGVRTIVVDTLALAGPLVMTNVGPNGRLDLFVNKITGDLILNQEGEAKDKPTALTLYYSGTEAFKMTNPNKQKITGNIVIGYADVEVDNEAAEVDITGGYLNGNLFTMGSYVKMRGNPDASSSLIYAPNAKVEMTGGAFVGAVIAQTFEAKGNSEIVYPEGHDFVATFPKDIFGSDFDAEETSGLRKGTWSPIR